MSDSIFVIHKSTELRGQVRSCLESAGYLVAGADSVEGAVADIETAVPALILIGWRGPTDTEMDIGHFRAGPETRASRIIVAAEEEEIGEAIEALEYGADDCVAVPFLEEELVGRVNACLRRPPAVRRRDQVRAGPLLLDRAAHRLLISEDSVPLAPTEFRLMEFFIEHAGRAFSRQELLQHAWPRHVSAGRRAVDVNVRRLRQALEPYGCDHLIQTVRRYGYRFSLDDRSAPKPIVLRSAAYSRP